MMVEERKSNDACASMLKRLLQQAYACIQARKRQLITNLN